MVVVPCNTEKCRRHRSTSAVAGDCTAGLDQGFEAHAGLWPCMKGYYFGLDVMHVLRV